MGTADEHDLEDGAPPKGGDHPEAGDGKVSDAGGDSDPGAATGEDQAAENRDRESPS